MILLTPTSYRRALPGGVWVVSLVIIPILDYTPKGPYGGLNDRTRCSAPGAQLLAFFPGTRCLRTRRATTIRTSSLDGTLCGYGTTSIERTTYLINLRSTSL